MLLAQEIKNQDGGGGGGGSTAAAALRASPAVVFVVVIVAVVLFVSGLLHLLVRFLLRRGRARAEGGAGEAPAGGGGAEEAALQRQLQQLFHLHDSGLDQDVIDALPVFLYQEVVGAAKEPFDCAVCLCEFAGDDRLRLLPLCGHAFHLDCIDTWLLSNSTCPLCRGALGADALFDAALVDMAGEDWKQEDAVFPVRLGKFKNLSRAAAAAAVHDDIAGGGGVVTREEGETSSSSLDARRCYSMGSYQYVLAEASLQVSVHRRHGDGNGRAAVARLRGIGDGATPAAGHEAVEGKKIGAASKGDSFSVSKIWQWPRNGKGKLPVLESDDSPALDGRLQWPRRSIGDS